MLLEQEGTSSKVLSLRLPWEWNLQMAEATCSLEHTHNWWKSLKVKMPISFFCVCVLRISNISLLSLNLSLLQVHQLRTKCPVCKKVLSRHYHMKVHLLTVHKVPDAEIEGLLRSQNIAWGERVLGVCEWVMHIHLQMCLCMCDYVQICTYLYSFHIFSDYFAPYVRQLHGYHTEENI